MKAVGMIAIKKVLHIGSDYFTKLIDNYPEFAQYFKRGNFGKGKNVWVCIDVDKAKEAKENLKQCRKEVLKFKNKTYTKDDLTTFLQTPIPVNYDTLNLYQKQLWWYCQTHTDEPGHLISKLNIWSEDTTKRVNVNKEDIFNVFLMYPEEVDDKEFTNNKLQKIFKALKIAPN